MMEKNIEDIYENVPDVLKDLVSQKLNLGVRSCTFILKNKLLVERIINENPILLKEFCHNIDLSRNLFNKYFIETNIVSYFKTNGNNGHTYIFANEFWENYEKGGFNFLDSSQSIDWNFESIENSIAYILEIAVILGFTSHRKIDVLTKIYIEKKSYDEIAVAQNVSVERIRQLFKKGQQEVFKHFKTHSRRINYYKKELNTLHSKVKFLENENEDLQLQHKKYQSQVGKLVNNEPNIEEDTYFNKLLNQNIKDIGFSQRIYTCLYQENIHTIKDLIRLDKRDLLKIRNLGNKSIRELTEFVNSVELSFGYTEKN